MNAVQTRRQRADRGHGSVKQVESGKHKGKWRARLTYRDQWNRKQDLDKLFPSQSEAKAHLRQFKRDLEAGKAANTRGYTLAQWFEWLKEHDWPGTIKTSTISYRTFRFNKYTRPVLGDALLSMIKPMMAKAFYKELKSCCYS